MKKRKAPITKFPGNKWLVRQVEKAGSESSIPFIHGVVRGVLANPSDVDAGDALEAVLEDADMKEFSQDEFDKLSIAFLFLYSETANCLSSSRPFPEAVSSDFRTQAGELNVLFEAADLVAGFAKGFHLKNPVEKERLPRTYVCLTLLKEEAEWCRMMYEDRRLREKTFPQGGLPSDVISETAEWIEECTRKVALLARGEMKNNGVEERGNKQ